MPVRRRFVAQVTRRVACYFDALDVTKLQNYALFGASGLDLVGVLDEQVATSEVDFEKSRQGLIQNHKA